MKIWLYDTTLRDGAQREGLSLSLEDKLRIARQLDRLGIPFIEGGWPGANPKDVQFFWQLQEYTPPTGRNRCLLCHSPPWSQSRRRANV